MIEKQNVQKKRPTAWAVARLAGVSQSTVSFVLNDRRDVGIPESTRQAVIAAARQLGYRPNLAARSLVRGKTNAMALWITKLSAPVYFMWAEYLQQEVHSHGYELIVGERVRRETDLQEYSLSPEWPVDGLFAYGVGEYLVGKPVYIPTVIFGPYPVDDFDYVGLSFYNAEIEAVQHLISHGRKRIVFVQALPGSSDDGSVREERHDAYITAMKEAGLPGEVFRLPGVARLQAYECAKEYLCSHQYPDAFVCLNDDIAVGVLRALYEAGIKVPDDVAIIGCDGLEEMDYHQPPISTILTPFAEISEVAWRFMENRLNDSSTPRQVATLDARFVARASSFANCVVAPDRE